MTQGTPSNAVFLADLNKKYSRKSLSIALLSEERESDVHESEN